MELRDDMQQVAFGSTGIDNAFVRSQPFDLNQQRSQIAGWLRSDPVADINRLDIATRIGSASSGQLSIEP